MPVIAISTVEARIQSNENGPPAARPNAGRPGPFSPRLSPRGSALTFGWMSFKAYSRLFFSLLVAGIVALVLMMGMVVFSNSRWFEEKTLGASAMFAIGCAALVNTACGIQHKKMWTRGGIDTYERFGRLFYITGIAMFSLGVFMIVIAVKTWGLSSHM